jgi:hypothetical protein
MAERIELTVRISEYPEEWSVSPAMWECWLVGKLKEAGVPVDGKLIFRGIKSGTLTRFDDPKDFGATKYVWES